MANLEKGKEHLWDVAMFHLMTHVFSYAYHLKRYQYAQEGEYSLVMEDNVLTLKKLSWGGVLHRHCWSVQDKTTCPTHGLGAWASQRELGQRLYDGSGEFTVLPARILCR